MHEVLKNPFVRERTRLVVTDGPTGAEEKAAAHGVTCEVIDAPDVDTFCSRLLQHLERASIDVVLSFYTSFFSAAVRERVRDRILNFHPSLLPAFKGMDGFGDTVAYGARFAGNTVELIADVMDEGKIVMQTVCPVDDSAIERTRHELFVQQCRVRSRSCVGSRTPGSTSTATVSSSRVHGSRTRRTRPPSKPRTPARGRLRHRSTPRHRQGRRDAHPVPPAAAARSRAGRV